jgi:hypothetical protein
MRKSMCEYLERRGSYRFKGSRKSSVARTQNQGGEGRAWQVADIHKDKTDKSSKQTIE